MLMVDQLHIMLSQPVKLNLYSRLQILIAAYQIEGALARNGDYCKIDIMNEV